MKRARNPLFAAAACAFVLAVGAPSWADDATSSPPRPAAPAEDQQAEELFQNAESLAREGKQDEAFGAYRAAWARRRDQRTAARLGELELAQGKAVDAAAHLGFAVRAFPAGGPPEALAQLQQRLAEAKRAVGEVLVHANTPLAEVWIDGVHSGLASDGAVYVAPGPHRVQIKSPGYIGEERAVDAAAGSSQEITASLARSLPLPAREELLPPPVRKEKEMALAAGSPEPLEGKSTPLIAAGLVTGGLLAFFGMNLLINPKDEGERGLGTAMFLGGSALAVGVGIYGIWPEPGDAAGRGGAGIVVGPRWKRSEAGWVPEADAATGRSNRSRIPDRSRGMPAP